MRATCSFLVALNLPSWCVVSVPIIVFSHMYYMHSPSLMYVLCMRYMLHVCLAITKWQCWSCCVWCVKINFVSCLVAP